MAVRSLRRMIQSNSFTIRSGRIYMAIPADRRRGSKGNGGIRPKIQPRGAGRARMGNRGGRSGFEPKINAFGAVGLLMRRFAPAIERTPAIPRRRRPWRPGTPAGCRKGKGRPEGRPPLHIPWLPFSAGGGASRPWPRPRPATASPRPAAAPGRVRSSSGRRSTPAWPRSPASRSGSIRRRTRTCQIR